MTSSAEDAFVVISICEDSRSIFGPSFGKGMTTRSVQDQKEDMRARMAELEKKLVESEAERCKLEKTCSALMRAFREEEKLRYKALNTKYEKFLEDCSVRRRRNEIILRSLCRIEDRSKALFAKTERLKILKDRYISYLRINDVKRDDVSSHFSNFPSTNTNDKAVRWKIPFPSSSEEDFPPERPFSPQKHPNLEKSIEGQGKPGGSDCLSRDRPTWKPQTEFAYPISVERKSEEFMRDRDRIITPGIEARSKSEPVQLSRAEEKPEWNDPKGRTLPQTDNKSNELNPVPTQSNTLNQLTRNSQHVATSKANARDEEFTELENIEEEGETPPPSEKPLPQGLDGVDYQNETYPESYYEQPVHRHNHTSIASDVILEEDETEDDVDEEEKDLCSLESGRGTKTWQQQPSVVEPFTNCTSTNEEEASKGYLKSADGAVDSVRSRGSDSEKGSGGKPSEEHSVEAKGGDAMERNRMGRSNLIHMLESDSESFQIEHGDGVSGNEDSDFDFSFSKN